MELNRSVFRVLMIGLIVGAVLGLALTQTRVFFVKSQYEKQLEELQAENDVLDSRLQRSYRIFSELEMMSHALTHVRVALLVNDYEAATFGAAHFKDAATNLEKHLGPEEVANLQYLTNSLLEAMETRDEEAINEKTHILTLMVQILRSEFGVQEDVDLVGAIEIKTRMRFMDHEFVQIATALSNDDFASAKDSFERLSKTYNLLAVETPQAWHPYFREDVLVDLEENLAGNRNNDSLVALNKLRKNCDKCHTIYR